MIPKPADAEIDAIESALDAASHDERVAWMRALRKKDMDVLYDRIIAGDYDFSPAPHLSHAARDLIQGLPSSGATACPRSATSRRPSRDTKTGSRAGT